MSETAGGTAGWWRAPLLTGIALVTVVALPLVVAVVALRTPQWFPYADSAVLELRLRDVFGPHTPLVGAIGRFGDDSTLANHPGPLGLYLLWPTYRLLGQTAWATIVATVLVHLGAIATIVWIALRRGGTALAVGTTAVLAVLVHGYGPALLADAWNPFVPLLWWLVFLLAIWSIVCDDLAMLPVAVGAGSLCAQSHVSYVGMTVAVGLTAVGWAAVTAWRGDRRARRRLGRWVGIAATVGVVLWLPPIIEELQQRPGNLSEIWSSFTDPAQHAIGIGRGIEVVFLFLNPATILTHGLGREKIEFAPIGRIPGVVFLCVWFAAALASWRPGDGRLRRLHVVVALALGVGALSCSRVVGDVLSYLFLWIWGVAALMTIAVGWSLVVIVRAWKPQLATQRVVVGVTGAVLAFLVAMTAVATVDASSAHIDDERVSSDLGRLVDPTVAALRRMPGAESGNRYLVTWVDPLNFGLQGFGLMNELERRGLEVGADRYFAGAVTPHRVLEPEEATAVVHLAVGPEIDRWDQREDATRVAYYDPRTPAQRAEYRRLRRQVVVDLVNAGMHREVEEVDRNLVTVLYYQDRLRDRTVGNMRRMIGLGLDLAVFVAPPDVPTTESGARRNRPVQLRRT